ncbi:MAG: GSU2403 family nucleotidyltransferase fold protein [Pseudomonadota bacterium]
MELPRITDLAARQAIDSTRLFREYVRVRRELDALDGSLFFKKVGTYEYLLHKVRGVIHRKGKRSPATEAERAEFQATKHRLKARLEILKTNVEINQRMNKAVQAGAVPTEVIEVLTQLEQHGLADKSVILGWPALYAYSQSSGVKLDSVKLEGQKGALLERHPDALRVLVQSPRNGPTDLLRQLKHSLRAVAEVEASAAPHSPWWDLNVRFATAMPRVAAKTKASAKTRKFPEKGLAAAKARKVMTLRVNAAASQHAAHTDAWVKLLVRAPTYEQVVVGKTGKMAVMRTLDPQVFVSWEHALQLRRGKCADSEQTEQKIRLVEGLLESSMVTSKLDAAASEALNNEVLALAAAGEVALDRV